MQEIEIDYTVTLTDFRRASYYGLFLRYKKPLLIMFIVVFGGILYAIAGLSGAGTINYLVLFIAAAYLIWGIVIFSGEEKNIRKYLRSPDHLLGCRYHLIFDKNRIRITVPERGISANYAVSKLACVFEISSMFLVYPTTQETYIIPLRAMSSEQRNEMRSTFRTVLKDRFGSRFDTGRKKQR